MFDHQQIATKVKIHMFTLPDGAGKKTVMLLVKRSNQPLVIDAISEKVIDHVSPVQLQSSVASPKAPSVQDVVNAVMAAMNQKVPGAVAEIARAQSEASVKNPPNSGTRHQDILSF